MSSRKRKELDPYMRTRICELRNTAQWSYGRIHKAYPDIPLSTIKSTCRSQKKRVNNQSRPRSGRPRKDRPIESSQDQMSRQPQPEQILDNQQGQHIQSPNPDGNEQTSHQRTPADESRAGLRDQQTEGQRAAL
ncbi:hypothetical protein N7486_006347 [Penicillium sp. IBT 16267x]|nr:hypothetical protein N7486_006347 [Penicillium sp. IBT 16267x]